MTIEKLNPAGSVGDTDVPSAAANGKSVVAGFNIVIDKLNEVIEAVNAATIQRADDLRAIWSNLNSLLVPEAEPQEQEMDRLDTLLATQDGRLELSRMVEEGHLAAKEAQRSPLDKAVSDYAKIIREHQTKVDKGYQCYPQGVAQAREAIFAAAHREYAQPETIRPGYEFTIPQPQWNRAEIAATAARQMSAAQRRMLW